MADLETKVWREYGRPFDLVGSLINGLRNFGDKRVCVTIEEAPEGDNIFYAGNSIFYANERGGVKQPHLRKAAEALVEARRDVGFNKNVLDCIDFLIAHLEDDDGFGEVGESTFILKVRDIDPDEREGFLNDVFARLSDNYNVMSVEEVEE